VKFGGDRLQEHAKAVNDPEHDKARRERRQDDEPCPSAVDGGRGSWLHPLAARRAASSGRSRHTPELLVGRQSGVSYRADRTAASSRSLLFNSGGQQIFIVIISLKVGPKGVRSYSAAVAPRSRRQRHRIEPTGAAQMAALDRLGAPRPSPTNHRVGASSPIRRVVSDWLQSADSRRSGSSQPTALALRHGFAYPGQRSK
jgi:hypothetical protein